MERICLELNWEGIRPSGKEFLYRIFILHRGVLGMAEKRNENKIMAMLERKGVVRKVGADGELMDVDSYNAHERNGSDIRVLIEHPEDNVRVTPAARQPVPGMPSPVFRPEKPAELQRELPQDGEPEMIKAVEAFVAEPEPVAERPEPPMPVTSPMPVISQAPVASQKPASAFGGLNIFRNGTPSDNKSVDAMQGDAKSQPENYTDKFLNTEELYEALALRSKKTDTIYLIEEYLHTLPDSLPDSSRREIVNKLIAASGFDFDLLMGDGVLRVKMLKEYAERFARHTDDYIAARQSEIDEMDQQILRSRRLIETRKELHKKQFFSIEAEAQRLKEILTFVSA